MHASSISMQDEEGNCWPWGLSH